MPFVARTTSLRFLPPVLAAMLVLACTPGGGGPSGNYEAKSPEGTFALEFMSGGKVRMVMAEAGGKADTTSGDFLVDGNKITIQAPGGMPLTLVQNGKTLDASMMGQILHFEKK